MRVSKTSLRQQRCALVTHFCRQQWGVLIISTESLKAVKRHSVRCLQFVHLSRLSMLLILHITFVYVPSVMSVSVWSKIKQSPQARRCHGVGFVGFVNFVDVCFPEFLNLYDSEAWYSLYQTTVNKGVGWYDELHGACDCTEVTKK